MYLWQRGRLPLIVSLCLPWDAKLLNEGRQLRWAGKERVGRRTENCARQGGAALDVPSLSSSEILPISTGINVIKEVFGNVINARCLEGERRSLMLTKLHLKKAIWSYKANEGKERKMLNGMVGSKIMSTQTRHRKVQEKWDYCCF
ncbi:unnamed protein product [Brugia pahangi]|uniref:Secreted protein n=1 Tax=Brugia pahangi TaxID=6280 RepID=A0A0N4TIG6_BRUPA|nr:unnamed protein product [Brugia pahangi]